MVGQRNVWLTAESYSTPKVEPDMGTVQVKGQQLSRWTLCLAREYRHFLNTDGL